MSDSHASAQPPGGRRKVLTFASVAVLATAALAVWLLRGDDDHLETRAISVVAIIRGSDNISGEYLDCRGVNDFSDFNPGQPVSLLDTDGHLVAVATIGDGEAALEKLTNEEELNNNETGLVSEIHARAYEKVSIPFRQASGHACAVHMLFRDVDINGLYTIEVGDHRFSVDVARAPIFNSMVWTLG